ALYGIECAFTPADEAVLIGHAWPGNVRELANVIERAVVLAEDGVLALWLENADTLRPDAGAHPDRGLVAESGGAGGRAAVTDQACGVAVAGPQDLGVRGQRRAVERAAITAALAACGGNKTKAAARLGISRRGLL